LINAVFENPPCKGGELLLLVNLARYASDEGTRVYPSIARMAKETNQTTRAVEKQLAKLRDKGILVVVHKQHMHTTGYRIAKPKVIHSTEQRSGSHPNFKQAISGLRSRGPEPRSDNSLDTLLNRQQLLETPHVKSETGEAALEAIAKLLPKFKRAQQGENQ